MVRKLKGIGAKPKTKEKITSAKYLVGQS